MADYKYKAQDLNGKKVSGVLQAGSEIELHEKLKQSGKLLVSAKVVEDRRTAKRLRSDRLSDFSGNLGRLVGAGVPLVKALRIAAADESVTASERKIYNHLLSRVCSGVALSDALAGEGGAFPPLFVNMIRSAETGGNLEQVCTQMAVYYDKEHRLGEKIKSSMLYPKILCALIIGVVAVIMGYVIPQFESLFSQMDVLPASTRVLLAVSSCVKTRWYMLLLFAALFAMVFRHICLITPVRRQRDRFLLHLPVAGKLLKVIYSARFARTLSSLYAAGIPIVSSLNVARATIGNMYIESQFEKVVAKVCAGGKLSDALDDVDGFTKKLSSVVMVGEETGALDTMLVTLAGQMEYEAEQALGRLIACVEPLMIVAMAAVVGFIMISVIRPIYGSYEMISNSYL